MTKAVIPYIGSKPLAEIHAGTLEAFVKDRRAAGIKAGTINRDIAIVRRVLNLAAGAWRDERGRPWIDATPMLFMVKGEKRKPRPITQAEQALLFKALPGYLAEMALFAVNTGLRDQELCGLRWEQEFKVSGLDATVFVVSEDQAKNGRERLTPLNAVARSIVEARRKHGGEFVFEFDGKRLSRMNNRAWRTARKETGLETVRVHDLRHAFGERLRAAGVSLEDRQDLLGHHAGHITTHYSEAQISKLIECVETLCDEKEKPDLTLIRRAS